MCTSCVGAFGGTARTGALQAPRKITGSKRRIERNMRACMPHLTLRLLPLYRTFLTFPAPQHASSNPQSQLFSAFHRWMPLALMRVFPSLVLMFLPATGLEMKVGGTMTHGAIVARAYVFPANGACIRPSPAFTPVRSSASTAQMGRSFSCVSRRLMKTWIFLTPFTGKSDHCMRVQNELCWMSCGGSESIFHR